MAESPFDRLSNFFSRPQALPQEAHIQEFEKDRSKRALTLAKYISQMIDTPSRGGPQERGGARINRMMYYPEVEVAKALHVSQPFGGLYNQDFGEKLEKTIGSPLEYPFYGGLKFIVPPSAGLPATANVYNQRAPRITSMDDLKAFKDYRGAYARGEIEARQNTDPLAQEIYGHLVRMGHPLYGLHFEDVYGKPGLIGFGAH